MFRQTCLCQSVQHEILSRRVAFAHLGVSLVDLGPSSSDGMVLSCALETLSSWNLFANTKLFVETLLVRCTRQVSRKQLSRHLVPKRKCRHLRFLWHQRFIVDDSEKIHVAVISSHVLRFVCWRTLFLFTRSFDCCAPSMLLRVR